MGTKVLFALKEMDVKQEGDLMTAEVTYLMNATMGRMSALLTLDSSLVKRGTAALTSLNRKSISTTTVDGDISAAASASVLSSGAVSAGFASTRWPGNRSCSVTVDMLFAIWETISLMSKSWSGSDVGGNLKSSTVSNFPDVIHEIGPSEAEPEPVAACRWSIFKPSIRNRD